MIVDIDRLRRQAMSSSEAADAADEFVRMFKVLAGVGVKVGMAHRKLSCVAVERSCPGVPQIIQVCDRQAQEYLQEALDLIRGAS